MGTTGSQVGRASELDTARGYRFLVYVAKGTSLSGFMLQLSGLAFSASREVALTKARFKYNE